MNKILLKTKKFPSLPEFSVFIDGNLEDYKVTYDFEKVKAVILKKGIGNLIGKRKKIIINPKSIDKILKEFKVKKNVPWSQIPKKVKNIILYGDENSELNFLYDFEGIINFIDRKYEETERWWLQYELEKYLSERDCEVCNGFRLNEKALAVKIDRLHVGEITKKSISESLEWFNKLNSKLDKNNQKIAEGVIKEIKDLGKSEKREKTA